MQHSHWLLVDQEPDRSLQKAVIPSALVQSTDTRVSFHFEASFLKVDKNLSSLKKRLLYSFWFSYLCNLVKADLGLAAEDESSLLRVTTII